jgi:bifunctional ADP-heptose synthase (sugar kinase/adenylyltransferase)
MKLARIYNKIEDFESELSYFRSWNKPIVMTSGYMSPCHSGHIRCLLQSGMYADSIGGIFVVVVNGDGALMRKKGFCFMKEDERAEIVAAIKGVDAVIIYDDGTQFVSGAISYIVPKFFIKGGDRIEGTIPELEICNEIGCKILYGFGGEKIQSSTALIEGAKAFELSKKCEIM